MRIGIISDTHDKLDRTRFAVDLLCNAGAQVLFHCGDLISPPIVRACGVLPCYFTFGNNDADRVPELHLVATEIGAVCVGWGDIVVVAEKRIGLVHGHLTTDLRRITSANPDYVLSGHSHIPNDSRSGKIRRINPGALHRAGSFSVAVLDLESDELRFLPVPR